MKIFKMLDPSATTFSEDVALLDESKPIHFGSPSTQFPHEGKMESRELAQLQTTVGTVAMENAELKNRIAVLEKNHRKNIYARLGFVLVTCILFLTSYQLKQTFSGRWMAVNDRDGHTSAWLDDTGLQLKDKRGRVRAALGLFPDGTPFLQLFSEGGAMKAQLFIYPHDEAGYLMLWGKDGKGVRYPPMLPSEMNK